jgi:hypothetical protein
MKKVVSLLSTVLLLASLASAQNKKESEHLLISEFIEAGGLAGMHEKVIVTKQDGSQEVIKDHSLRNLAFSSKGVNVTEDSVMQMLKPYFENGWELISVSSMTIPQGTTGVVTRYFLSKKDE